MMTITCVMRLLADLIHLLFDANGLPDDPMPVTRPVLLQHDHLSVKRGDAAIYYPLLTGIY